MAIEIGPNINIGRRKGVAVSGGGGFVPTFLLRADFNTDIAAPLPSPLTVDVGTLTVTDTGNKVSAASGQLVATSGGGAANPGIWSTALARLAGRALVSIANPVNNNYDNVGFSAASGGNGVVAGIYFYAGDLSLGEYQGVVFGAYSTNTPYRLATVLRTTGALNFIKGGAFTQWTFVYPTTSNAAATLYATWHSRDPGANFKIDTFRVLDLPSPFATDYGIATQRLSGARSVNDTFTHEANAVIEFTQTTLPSASTQSVFIRRVDSSNYWSVDITSANVLLREVVAGTPTTRGSTSHGLSNGQRVVVVADGSTIRIYCNNVLKITYASASNFATATAGELNNLGTGGAVSEIVSYPRQLTGAAAALLDAAVA